MWNRNVTPAPEKSKGNQQSQRIQGKYDWRLWSRRKEMTVPSHSDASFPGTASGGSLPEALPAGLFAPGGSNGSISGRSASRGQDESAPLLHPGRAAAATPGSSVSSQNPTFLYTPNDNTARFSRSTSVDSIFDESQERCIHTAYRISFQGDKRIKEKPFRIVVDGVSFVLVERVVSGHSDGVYQKSKKVWEHVPRGQVRVFASVVTTPLRSFPSSPVGTVAYNPATSSARSAASSGSPATAGAVRRPRSVSPNASFGNGSFTTTHTLVASLNGLRKFAHWGDTSSSIYNVNKEVPVMAVAVEKVDGESCHVTGFTFEDVRYWVIGLRDRHLLVRLWVPQEDVEAYRDSDVAPPASSSSTGGHVNTPSAAVSGAAQTGSTTAATSTVSATAKAFTRAAMKVALAWRQLLRERLTEEEVLQLHQSVAERQWTLCFDAVVMGCEHFVDYYSTAASESTNEASEGEQGPSPTGDDSKHVEPTLPLHGTESCCTERHVDATEGPGTESDDSRTDCANDPLLLPPPDAPASGVPVPESDALPLFFYAITFHESSDKGLCLPVEESMAFFAQYHLPVAARAEPLEVNSPEYDAHRADIARQLNSAGAVFYGTNEQGLVVRLWKCRCYPYELERAAQEFIVTHRLHGSILQAKFQKKLSGLSKEARANAVEWEKVRLPFLYDFAEWLHTTQQLTPSTDLASLQVLRGHWITAQHAYRHDLRERGEHAAGEGDDNLAAYAPDGDVHEGEDGEEDEEIHPEVILLVGPQGCGKSTLARALYTLLEQAGCLPRWINQDEVGNRKAYLAAIRSATSSGAYSHIILDKMNLDEASRGDYVELNLKTVLVVAWSHTNGTEALAEVCFERVKRRGGNHRTFKTTLDLEERDADVSPASAPAPGSSVSPKSVGSPQPHASSGTAAATGVDMTGGGNNPDQQLRKIRGILYDCAKRYELPESTHNLLELEVTLNCNATIQRVWARLREHSIYELPELNQLDVEEAFAVAFGYEQLMRTYPQRITAVILQADAPEEIKETIPNDILEGGGKKALEQIHIVLHNFAEQPSPVALVRYAALVGKLMMVDMRAVVSDAKATLLHVGDVGPEAGGAPTHSISSGAVKSLKVAGSGPSATLTSACETVPAASPTSSNSTASEASSADPAPSLCMAVVSKAKKVSYRYCTQLLERVVLCEEPDPYIIVRPYPRGTSAAFTYHFVTQ